MIKLIHTGDIHIGSALKNLPAEKAKIRKAELIDGFAKICKYAQENGVYGVLIAGDLFDETGVPAHILRQVFSLFENSKPVRFFYVSGNHDGAQSLMRNAPDNVFFFSQNQPFTTYDLGENVTLTGMDERCFSTENFMQMRFAPDAFNILTLHGDIKGDNRAKSHVPLSLLQNKNVDYLALGHIHQPTRTVEKIDARGHYRYCGTPESRGFDELGERGFFLLEIANGRLINEKFLSFATRSAREVRVDISHCREYAEIERAVFSATQNVPRGDMLYCVLCGGYAVELRKDLSLLTARLLGEFFHVKVCDESRLILSPSAFEKDVTERGEFVREVHKYGLAPLLKEEVLEVGLKALFGEEIDL